MMGVRAVQIDLTKDCGLVVDNVVTPRPITRAPNFVREGKLRSRKQANRNPGVSLPETQSGW